MGTCDQCASAEATTTSPTGRPWCADCFHELSLLTAAGGAHSDVFAVEGRHRAEQAERLAAATGFWARLRIRVLG